MFIEYLAGINGFNIDFSSVTAHDMIEASALAFGGNYVKLNELFDEITDIIPYQEQRNNIISFFGADSEQCELIESNHNDLECEEGQNMTM